MPSRVPPDVVDDGEVEVDVVFEGVGVNSDVGGNIATSGRQLAKTVWSSANSLSPVFGCMPVRSRPLGGLARYVLAPAAPLLSIGSRKLIVPPSLVRPLDGGQVLRDPFPGSKPASSP